MKTIPSYKNKKIQDIPKNLDSSIALKILDSGLNSSAIVRYEISLGGYPVAASSLSDASLSLPIVDKFVDEDIPFFKIDIDRLLSKELLPPNIYDVKLHIHRSLSDHGAVRFKHPLSFYIKEISPKRDEMIIGVHDPLLVTGTTTQVVNQIKGYWSRASAFIMEDLQKPSKSLVFSDGSVHTVINNKVQKFPSYSTKHQTTNPGSIVLKLSEPLPRSLGDGDLCRLEQKITEVREVKVKLKAADIPSTNYILKAPNFTAPVGSAGATVSTKFESWDSLLSGDPTTKDRLLNGLFSGSKASSAELGIDYRKYSNFVNFSSANERLENFKYKIQLVEYYDSKLTSLASATSSTIATNRLNYITKKNKVIASFDGYENYLYYESSSYETSSYGSFNASTWPKTNSTIPYTLALSSTTDVTTWLTAQTATALDYDINNAYNLEKTIPDHIKLDVQNANYLMFVNMMGQHFDTVYNYVDHMTKIHDRSNELDLGLSKDMLWDTLKSLGWHGVNGYNFEDLWSYTLGTDDSGSYQTTDSGSTQTSVISTSMPTSDITKEIWKRTLNNLPYILKTKGTERSIRALTNIYGLPPTVLRIREYGGAPKDMSTNQYVKYEQFNQSLVFKGSNYLKLPWGQLTSSAIPHLGTDTTRSPNVVEFRFNTNKPQSSVMMFQTYGSTNNNWQIEIEKHPSASNTSSGYHNHGRLWSYIRHDSTVSDISSSYTPWVPIFDNDWWNVQWGVNSTDYAAVQTFKLDLWKASDHSKGMVTHKVTSSMVAAQTYWHPGPINNNATALYVGGQTSGYDSLWETGSYDSGASSLPGYTGSLQEIRYWSFTDDARLTDAAFTNHVLSPLSIESNTYTGSYSELVYRLPLGSDNKIYTLGNGTVISSSQPNTDNINIFVEPSSGQHWDVHSGSAHGFTGTSADWQYEEETYFTVVPEIIGTRAVSDKIRIESGSITGQLLINQSIVSNSIQLAAIDSPKLGVYYSPVDDIDIDISHQIGGAKFDDFVGNPRDAYRTRYKELTNIRKHYWSKYSTSPTFGAYLKALKYFDHSIFHQVESLLPARAKEHTGLLIKPNLLERPTIAKVSESFENLTYGMGTIAGNSVKYSFASDTMDLGALENDTYAGCIPATNKTYMVYGRNLANKANTYLPNSFDDSVGTYSAQGSVASQDIPTYDNITISKKFVTYTSGSNTGPVAVQEYLPTAIRNQRYGGTKYGKVAGSIGGIINLINDPSVSGDGLFDSTATHNIKCAIEVVETNPITLEVSPKTISNRGNLTIR